MMTLKELNRRAARERVLKPMVEKDVALTVTLDALAQTPLSRQVVFKGGTAIRKMYFPNARYSEDLDFTAAGVTPGEVLAGVREALEGRALDGIAFGTVENVRSLAGLKLAVKFTGPLQHPQRVWFDFSFRGDLKLPPVLRPILDLHVNPRGSLWTMALSEILAEKVRAVCSRRAARDLYDFWFLTCEQRVPLDLALVAQKFELYGEKPTMERFGQNARALQAQWKTDLQPFLNPMPDFQTVYRQAVQAARKTLPAEEKR